MKTGSRPQYYRIRRMVQMVREGAETGYLANSSNFMKEFEVSRRTVARDLDFLRDEERAPLAYDDARHGFRLTDETYTLPPVRISRKEAFSFGLARKLLAHYVGTPLHLDMRSVLDKIAESLEGDVTIEPDWLSEHVGVLPEDVFFRGLAYRLMWTLVWHIQSRKLTFRYYGVRGDEDRPKPWHLALYKAFNEVGDWMTNREILPDEAGVLYRAGDKTILWAFRDLSFKLPVARVVRNVLAGTQERVGILEAKRHHVYLIRGK